jgi:endonuclease-3 related protein
MTLRELYDALRNKFGERADPNRWWPIFFGRTNPPEFERVITNVLVTQSRWPRVPRAVEALERAGLLTARTLARAEEAAIAACVQPVGFQTGKASCLKAIAAFVLAHFGTEVAFCAGATREQLLTIQGVGPETADRILLYTCGRLAWPVDTYCLKVLSDSRYRVIPTFPRPGAEKRRAVVEIKQMVEREVPHHLDDWQRLHALMQLEGEDLQQRA